MFFFTNLKLSISLAGLTMPPTKINIFALISTTTNNNEKKLFHYNNNNNNNVTLLAVYLKPCKIFTVIFGIWRIDAVWISRQTFERKKILLKIEVHHLSIFQQQNFVTIYIFTLINPPPLLLFSWTPLTHSLTIYLCERRELSFREPKLKKKLKIKSWL
jgi:hypothetical protein